MNNDETALLSQVQNEDITASTKSLESFLFSGSVETFIKDGFAQKNIPKFQNTYIRTNDTEKLKQNILAGKNTLITGRPLSGKTRLIFQTILESESELNDHFLVISGETNSFSSNDLGNLLFGKSAILIFDNLGQGDDTFNPTKILRVAEETSKKTICIELQEQALN
jgi:predicted ATP-dependent serine protease